MYILWVQQISNRWAFTNLPSLDAHKSPIRSVAVHKSTIIGCSQQSDQLPLTNLLSLDVNKSPIRGRSQIYYNRMLTNLLSVTAHKSQNQWLLANLQPFPVLPAFSLTNLNHQMLGPLTNRRKCFIPGWACTANQTCISFKPTVGWSEKVKFQEKRLHDLGNIELDYERDSLTINVGTAKAARASIRP
jgi:hypothetical protein